MGNTWRYWAIQERPIDAAMVSNAIDCLLDLGYVPGCGPIERRCEPPVWLANEGWTSLSPVELPTREALCRYLAAQSGSAPFQRPFEPDADVDEGTREYGYRLELHVRHDEKRIGSCVFRALHRCGDEQLAGDHFRFLAALCERGAPRYAFATDEWSWGFAPPPCASEDDVLADVRSGVPPRVHFSFNFFGRSCRAPDELALSNVRCTRRSVESGEFVILAPEPWRARTATLQEDGTYLSRA